MKRGRTIEKNVFLAASGHAGAWGDDLGGGFGQRRHVIGRFCPRPVRATNESAAREGGVMDIQVSMHDLMHVTEFP